jgi:hypothetical protein
LDQFLEHLHNDGIKKIVRIGGQSQSTILDECNLRKISQAERKTKSEGYLLAKTYEALESSERSIKSILGRLHSKSKQGSWQYVRNHLMRNYPLIYAQLSDDGEDGFKMVGGHPFELWRKGRTQISNPQSETLVTNNIELILEKANKDVHFLSTSERHLIEGHWIAEIHQYNSELLFEEICAAKRDQKKLTNIHDEVDRRVLQDADVIGVTTSGLAKRISTLQRIRCKVILCEEAGEVMEPHMLSALLPSVEHFIQIGDHQQLRPQINNFDLSLESKRGLSYQLDRSQFERLSKGTLERPAIQIAQLSIQRRMRPEISTLIRETIYPRLVDHESVVLLKDVVGMRENVFWLDHKNFEDGKQSEMHHKSHSNLWEVDMVHALVRHIIRQGIYSSSDIAVLTPYTGQLQKLRAKMRNDFEIVLSERDEDALANDGFDTDNEDSSDGLSGSGSTNKKAPLEKKKLSELLRIATVDNFQGEEAKVVIISLVRSNSERKVGFLRTTNRINVLLSRAQNGMYIIGNTDTYSNVNMWQKVIGILEASGSVGQSFGLCCPRHPDTEIQVSQPEEFARLSPEGGCRLMCDRRLDSCGHRCQTMCHSESMHQVFACQQPCQRLHQPCNHSCQKSTCGEDCGNCLIKLNNVSLSCGHSKDDVYCYLTQDVGKIYCDTLVSKNVPRCGHTVVVPCSQEVASEFFECPTACKTILDCGHVCLGTCGKCSKKCSDGRRDYDHMSCITPCNRPFGTCNHICLRPCHYGKNCGPCFSACEVSLFTLFQKIISTEPCLFI